MWHTTRQIAVPGRIAGPMHDRRRHGNAKRFAAETGLSHQRSRHRSNDRMKGKRYLKKLTLGYGATPLLLCASVTATDLSQVAPLSDRQWDAIYSKVKLLDKVTYFPSLLPVIMKHRDVLGLSYRQTRSLRIWRKENYQQMVDLMNQIIEHRIELSKASLNAKLTNERILDKQQKIFELQEKVLRIRLSCRQIVMSTFSAEQWTSLGFVLEEYPQFAGLLDL
jgi:hypothetical protein